MMRRVYRNAVIVSSSDQGMQLDVAPHCRDCSAQCSGAASVLTLVGAGEGTPGSRVRLGLSARLFNGYCTVLFGPWLLVVAALIGLDGAGVEPAVVGLASLAGGAMALWAGRALAQRLADLSITVDRDAGNLG